MKGTTSSIIVLLAAIAGSGGLLAYCVSSAPRAATDVEAAADPLMGSQDRASSSSRTERAALGSRTSVDLQLARAVVVLGSAALPLSGAECREYVAHPDGTLDSTGDVLAASGTDGRITHSMLENPNGRFVVRKDGYVPAVVVGGFDGDLRVQLTVSAELLVRVMTDRGTRCSSAQVVVSPEVVSMDSHIPDVADGAPLHSRPVWSRLTDATGTAAFAGLPEGQLRLVVFHPFFVPMVNHHEFTLTEGKTTSVAITVQDMYGVAFVCPSSAAVASLDWDWPFNGVDLSYAVVSHLGYCTLALERRFPDAHVYVQRPRSTESEVVIGCNLTLSDGTLWKGYWPIVPLRELLEPVFLEKSQAPTRRLIIELNSPTGRPLDVPIRLAGESESPRRSPVTKTIHPGQPQYLEYGHYCVEPEYSAAWMASASRDLSFDVSALEPASGTVHLRLSEEFAKLEILPTLPTEQALSSVQLIVDDSQKRGISIAAWKPSHGPIRMLAPVGPLSIRVRSHSYVDQDIDLTVPMQDVPFVVRIPLSEREQRREPK